MSEVLIIRFPDGDAEFSVGTAVPEVGNRLSKRGEAWIVVSVRDDAGGHPCVTVEPVEVKRDDGWPDPYAFLWRT